MKMKRFISAIAAITMISASLVSVSAAGAIKTEYNSEYDITMVTNLPAQSEVATRTPMLTIDSIEKLEGTAIKNNTDNAFYLANRNYDVYLMTYTFSNLGEVVVGFSSTLGVNAIGVYQAPLRFVGKNENIKAVWGADKSFSWADATGKYTSLAITYPTADPYPQATDDMNANYVANGSVTGKVAVALASGTTASFAKENVEAAVYYYLIENDVANQIIVDVEAPAVTFGATAPAETSVEISDAMELTGSNAGKEVKGVAWDVTIKNYDSEKTYSATISDSTGVRGNGAVELSGLGNISKIAETEGDIGFAVLVQLSKARTGLALDVDFE